MISDFSQRCNIKIWKTAVLLVHSSWQLCGYINFLDYPCVTASSWTVTLSSRLRNKLKLQTTESALVLLALEWSKSCFYSLFLSKFLFNNTILSLWGAWIKDAFKYSCLQLPEAHMDCCVLFCFLSLLVYQPYLLSYIIIGLFHTVLFISFWLA